jgi:hypothetical protein
MQDDGTIVDFDIQVESNDCPQPEFKAECVHAKDCPKKLVTDASKTCDQSCGGHHCTHWSTCSPKIKPTESQRKVQSEKDKAVALAKKLATPPVIPPKPDRALFKKKKDAEEALVAGSPQYDQAPIKHCLGVALKDGAAIAQVLSCWLGILINKHVYDVCDSVSFAGKVHIKTKVLYRGDDCGNDDLMVIDKYDGCPVGLAKKKFAVPEDSQKVGFINRKGAFCPGVVVKAIEAGATGKQMRNTCSTEPGDCGGPYLSVDGQVVAIHFSAGKKNKDNLGVPITDGFLALQRKN